MVISFTDLQIFRRFWQFQAQFCNFPQNSNFLRITRVLFYKNDHRKLKFGLDIPLNSINKLLGQIFKLIFRIKAFIFKARGLIYSDMYLIYSAYIYPYSLIVCVMCMNKSCPLSIIIKPVEMNRLKTFKKGKQKFSLSCSFFKNVPRVTLQPVLLSY